MSQSYSATFENKYYNCIESTAKRSNHVSLVGMQNLLNPQNPSATPSHSPLCSFPFHNKCMIFAAIFHQFTPPSISLFKSCTKKHHSILKMGSYQGVQEELCQPMLCISSCRLEVSTEPQDCRAGKGPLEIFQLPAPADSPQ